MKRIYLLIIILVSILSTSCSKDTKDDTSVEPGKDKLVFNVQIVSLDLDENVECYVISKEDIGYGDKPSLISLNIPFDQIYDSKDQLIKIDELKEGNILKITSDGVFLESYPLQIGTVYKVKVIEEGSIEDLKQYQDEIDQLFNEQEVVQ